MSYVTYGPPPSAGYRGPRVQMPLFGYGGLGAADFNADLIWGDCQKGGAGDNFAGKKCGQAVQMALNQLGYGPLAVDGQVGTQTMTALKAFSSDNGFPPSNWPTKAMVIKMGELMAAGEKPGPNEAVVSHVVNGEVVPGSAPGGSALAKMSTGTMLAIGAAAALAIGAVAIMAKKKKSSSKTGAPASSSTAMVKV